MYTLTLETIGGVQVTLKSDNLDNIIALAKLIEE